MLFTTYFRTLMTEERVRVAERERDNVVYYVKRERELSILKYLRILEHVCMHLTTSQ
jgi:hypothetical protein